MSVKKSAAKAEPAPKKPRNKIAIISVADKTGIADQAWRLVNMDWEIVSSGGTAKALIAAGVPVTTIADLRFRIFSEKMRKQRFKVKGRLGQTIKNRDFFELLFPTEMLGHRVATLHAEVHGGILAAQNMLQELEGLGYPQVDMVILDLYDLRSAVANPESSLRDVLDKIDIGGPTILCGASKNLLIVARNYAARERLIAMLEKDGDVDEGTRRQEAADTFAQIAQYRLLAAEYLSRGRIRGQVLERRETLLYGENANQSPAYLYTEFDVKPHEDWLGSLNFKNVQGAPLSFNNRAELSRLTSKLTRLTSSQRLNKLNQKGERDFLPPEPLCNCIASKHGNTAGAGTATNRTQALQRMINGDPLAIHGGLVITDFPIGQMEAEVLLHYKMPEDEMRLLDAIIAPEFKPEVLPLLKRKGINKLRLVENLQLGALTDMDSRAKEDRFVQVRGGWLIQPAYDNLLDLRDMSRYQELFVRKLTLQQKLDLCLAHMASHEDNSNTIAAAKNGAMLASGVGCQDRQAAAHMMLWKCARAGHDTKGAVASSDSFFIKADAPLMLAEAGFALIHSTFGSLKGDAEVTKMLIDRNERDEHIPGVLLVSDKTGRGFAHHDG